MPLHRSFCRLLPMLAFFLTVAAFDAAAQPYTLVRANWQDAGYHGAAPVFSRTISILDFGGDSTGALSSNAAFAAAVAALNGAPGVIHLPAGRYFFDAPLMIGRDSLVIRGDGYAQTRLRFDLSHQLSNAINISGTPGSDTALLTADAKRGDTALSVAAAASFAAGDWIMIGMDDRAFMTSSWAYGSLVQLVQVQRVSGNTLLLRTPLRHRYPAASGAFIRKIRTRREITLECFGIGRLDSTAGQASNIGFDYVVNSRIRGLASDSTNFAHIELDHSSNIDVTGSYLHHAFAYGGSGQGYGVLLQFGTGECRIEGNYFRHLRHSVLLQAGANGNVTGYNYSTDPYWTEPSLPSASAGELVLHGNYAFANLFEGNMVQNIVIDDSHGKNGPYNTFLRNRAGGYGLFMNFTQPTDSVQLIGNEITGPGGLFFLSGNGHLVYGNNRGGSLTSGTANIPDTSLYLGPGRRPGCMDQYTRWPVAGTPGGYNTGSIYAADRAAAGINASCGCAAIAPSAVGTTGGAGSWQLYPSPASDMLFLRGGTADRIVIYDATGRSLIETDAREIPVSHLRPGIYYARIIRKTDAATLQFVKE